MYTVRNFKTKKALKEAVAAGDKVRVFQPNALVEPNLNGSVCLEGPHYPEPHRWYASVQIKDGIIVPGTVK